MCGRVETLNCKISTNWDTFLNNDQRLSTTAFSLRKQTLIVFNY